MIIAGSHDMSSKRQDSRDSEMMQNTWKTWPFDDAHGEESSSFGETHAVVRQRRVGKQLEEVRGIAASRPQFSLCPVRYCTPFGSSMSSKTLVANTLIRSTNATTLDLVAADTRLAKVSTHSPIHTFTHQFAHQIIHQIHCITYLFNPSILPGASRIGSRQLYFAPAKRHGRCLNLDRDLDLDRDLHCAAHRRQLVFHSHNCHL